MRHLADVVVAVKLVMVVETSASTMLLSITSILPLIERGDHE